MIFHKINNEKKYEESIFITIVTIGLTVSATTQSLTEIAIVPEKARNAVINGKEEQAYELPDILPIYPGGINGIMSFLSANLVYPPHAAENRIQGRVLVQFVVDIKDNVSNVGKH